MRKMKGKLKQNPQIGYTKTHKVQVQQKLEMSAEQIYLRHLEDQG